MERRDVLRTSGAILSFALAGCSVGEWPNRSSPSKSTKTGNEATDTTTVSDVTTAGTTTEETTAATTTVGPAETQYELGAVHVHDPWRFAITTFELTTTFRTDDGETYDVPEGTKLGIATVKVTNQASRYQAWAWKPFAVISDGKVYESRQAFEHPEFYDSVLMDDLDRIEHARQYGPDAYPVEPDETVYLWALFVVPATATLGQLTVGFDGTPDDGLSYPVRWRVD